MIRVIAGKFKHRVLKQPSMSITRSTKDVCKEGLFSSLGDISELSFLDLFSGSGAIGIEFLTYSKVTIKILHSHTLVLYIKIIKISTIFYVIFSIS